MPTKFKNAFLHTTTVIFSFYGYVNNRLQPIQEKFQALEDCLSQETLKRIAMLPAYLWVATGSPMRNTRMMY